MASRTFHFMHDHVENHQADLVVFSSKRRMAECPSEAVRTGQLDKAVVDIDDSAPVMKTDPFRRDLGQALEPGLAMLQGPGGPKAV